MNYIFKVSSILAIGVFFASSSLAEYIQATNEQEIILVPTSMEVSMGKSLAKNVEKKFGVDEDAFLRERIQAIGQKIAAVSDRKDIIYHFSVLKGDKLEPDQRINAFALPGGYIFIFKDMLKMLETDDEIAGVLAHEVGHIAAKHSIKRLQGSLGIMALRVLSSGMSANSKDKGRINSAIGLLMMSYSRDDEATADRLSVKYIKRAGYDPKAILAFLDKLIAKDRNAPLRNYTSYRTHPYLSERKSAVKNAIYGKMDFIDFINTPVNIGKR